MEFNLFDTLYEEETRVENTISCEHDIVEENGALVCSLCYEEVGYATMELATAVNKSRYFMRKTRCKTIFKDIDLLCVSKQVKCIANDIYNEACEGKVHRGKFRKAIMFASIYYAYITLDNCQSCDTLLTELNIKRKDALKGLKYVNERLPKKSDMRNRCINTKDLIDEYLTYFHMKQETKEGIASIYYNIEKNSDLMNRSRPHSIAAGIIWYWISNNDATITIRDFTKKINLSELTIQKVIKEIKRIQEETSFKGIE